MKINMESKTIYKDGVVYDLHTNEGYELVKNLWEYTNWANKYSYTYSWLGRPTIQLPDDMVRVQELVFQLKPSIIIETGIAHGGSLIFYASLCELIGSGRVIGIDIDIRKHNKMAIESHALANRIIMLEGSSINPEIISNVKQYVKKEDTVLVILDSNHTKEHVLKELIAYSPLVSKNSYIIVADGIMQNLIGAPGARNDWDWNNPQEAIKEFLKLNNNFLVENPKPHFSESQIKSFPTYWPNGWLKRV